MAQRKETKTTIKVRDLKPKKDAKGGIINRGTPQGSRNVQTRQQNHHSVNIVDRG